MFRWIQTLLLSKKNFMFAHFVSFNFTRFGTQKKERAAAAAIKRMQKIMLRCEEEQIFYRVSIWWMNVYTRVMLNVYFSVDNC